MNREEYNRISKIILDSCITVHKEMGPGLLESVYELCLMKEFDLRNLKANNQVPIPLIYKGFELSREFRIDILVENAIILEIKSCENLLAVHKDQIISCLKLTKKKLGFLVNFNTPLLKDGFKRFVNNF
ncbi:MAG: GxxExxY protein [Candidatus Marinimicrobia bacterium]|nr:GxxExxY protein [Candidatus Neomarinimicrobiota bacterium]